MFDADQDIAGAVGCSVVAILAIERIGSGSAGQRVIAVVSADGIGSAVADDQVVGVATGDLVVSASTQDGFDVEINVVLLAGFAVVAKRADADGEIAGARRIISSIVAVT